jgi:hypothetical protein
MNRDAMTHANATPDLRLLRFLLAWTQGQPTPVPVDFDDLPRQTRRLLRDADRSVLMRLGIEALGRLNPPGSTPAQPEIDPSQLN